MASMAVKRLMSELKIVRKAMPKEEIPGLIQVEPVEDNLFEWQVDMRFPEDSPLQRSLNSYADALLEESRNMLSFKVRFPPDYPMVPPEVWLQKPRLIYTSGAAVTFGGKVCIQLLTRSVWTPATNMTTVFREVQTSLVEAGATVDESVAVKPYLEGPPMVDRLGSYRFPKANDFQKDALQILSPIEAGPFFGDLSRLEATDKIALSGDHGLTIYNRGDRIDLPIMFEIKTAVGRKTHCAIFDFMTGLPPEIVIAPKWVMNDLGLQERDIVRVRGVKLELIRSVKIQPHSVDFYEAVHRCGGDAGLLLTESLRRFSALTEETSIPIEIGSGAHDVHIVSLEPEAAVRIIDTDLSSDFEFKVDFEAAPNLEDEADKKARQEELFKRHQAIEEQQRALAASASEKRELGIRRHFERQRDTARSEAGADDGKEGTVNVRLRLPGGTNLDANFREGASAKALVAFVLASEWADKANPWGVRLLCQFPKRTLTEDDVVTKDMHRSAISVQEERPPDDEEAILAEAEEPEPTPPTPASAASAPEPGPMARMFGGLLARHSIWGDDAEDQNAIPGMDEAALEQRSLEMFEVQRFIQAGLDPEEAGRRVDAGQTATEDLAQRLRQHRPPPVRSRVPPPPPAPAAAPYGGGAPAPPAGGGAVGDIESQIAEVKNITGGDDGQVLQLLEQNGWDPQRAINAFFDSM